MGHNPDANLTIQVPDVYSGETKRIMVQLKVPTDPGKSIVLGSGQFVCTDISKNNQYYLLRISSLQ